MKKYCYLLFAMLIALAGCSGGDDNEFPGKDEPQQEETGNKNNKEDDKKDEPQGEDVVKDNKIFYTTIEGTELMLNSTNFAVFGANLLSNTYEDGQGVLTFDDAVTTIGEDAFKECDLLESIILPDAVTEIGEQAFAYCVCLKDVTIGSGVTVIGQAAFDYCVNLKSITIGSRVTVIGQAAFSNCWSLENITIPDAVTEIGVEAFNRCDGLQSVTFGSGVTWIKEYAFAYCWGLTSITIPEGVTSIGVRAFYDCTSVTEVYCKPTTPPTGDSEMFSGCSSELKIYIPAASVDAYKFAEGWSIYFDSNRIVGYNF